jgi:hypothetical protein
MIDETVGPSLNTIRLYNHVNPLESALTSGEVLDRKRIVAGLAVADMLGEKARDRDSTGFSLDRSENLTIQTRLIGLVLAADNSERIQPPLSDYTRSMLEVKKLTNEAILESIQQQTAQPFGKLPIDYYFRDQA